MGWIRVSDDFYDNPKVERVGPLGIAVFAVAMAYCNRNLSDGYFPKSKAYGFLEWDSVQLPYAVPKYVDNPAPLVIEWMVAAGLWHGPGHDCTDCHRRDDGGEPGLRELLIHDYLVYQPSREQVLAERKRLQEYRERKKAEKNGARTENVQRTNDVRTDVQTTSPTPTPSSSLVTYGGEGYVSNAREPRPRCSRHPDENFEGKCRACMKRRLWDEENEAALKADELDLKRRQRALAENCPVCQGTNWIPDTDPAVKCDHQVVQHA